MSSVIQYNFKDVQFMTAKEKELVLKSWITFVKHGYRINHFTKRIYNHLTQHCSFIAHFNQYGFYETYFENPEDVVVFTNQFDKDKGCISVEYGGQYWLKDSNYEDINKAMVDVVELYKDKIYRSCEKIERERDIFNAKKLLAKHGVSF